MDSQTARIKLTDLMRKHRDYGAQDSEGWAAMDQVAEAAAKGKHFPLTPHKNDDGSMQIIKRNPFQLYESVAGWEQVSAKLVAAAEVYWKTLVSENSPLIPHASAVVLTLPALERACLLSPFALGHVRICDRATTAILQAGDHELTRSGHTPRQSQGN